MSNYIVGLTGGVGSGKSKVADLFVENGAGLVDTDAIAHELTGPNGAAMPALVAEFGPAVANQQGALDRVAMRQRVFSDPGAKARLEGERCHRIVAVDCPESLQIKRVMARNGISADEVKAIMAAQATRAQRLAVADDVVTNDADLAKLSLQVGSLHEKYLHLSAEKPNASC